MGTGVLFQRYELTHDLILKRHTAGSTWMAAIELERGAPQCGLAACYHRTKALVIFGGPFGRLGFERRHASRPRLAAHPPAQRQQRSCRPRW